MIDDGKAVRGAAPAARLARWRELITAVAPNPACAGRAAGAPAIGDPRSEIVNAVHAAGRKNARRQVAGHELLQRIGIIAWSPPACR
jgi:hypothetical protein